MPPNPLVDASSVIWNDDDVELYHGTFEDCIDAIKQEVQLPSVRNRVTKRAGGYDFGDGFYVSFSRQAAIGFSQQKVARSNGRRDEARPAVLRFTVRRRTLSELDTIWFPEPNVSYDLRDPYWRYVNYCRAVTHIANGPGRPPPVPDPYDLAVGPMAFLNRGRPTIEEWKEVNGKLHMVRPRLWQACFKTADAVSLLNSRVSTRIDRVF